MFKKIFAVSIILISVCSLIIGLIGLTIKEKKDIKSDIHYESRFSIIDGVRVFDKSKGPGIGVIYLYGGIYTADKGMFGLQSGSDMIVQQINNLSKNDRVKAVLLRINSPGGSIAATQEITDEIKSLKEKNIKIIVSMADVAASGAYYIASQADLIIANSGTITGSIGVFTGTVEFSELFEKIGITPNIIVSGKYKDTLSSFREMRDDEKNYIQELVMKNYEMFVEEVSNGRKINKEDVYNIADGRIFTGQKALEYGLIDEIGNFNYSLKRAAEISGLEHPADIIYPSGITNFSRFIHFIESKTNFLNISKIFNSYSLPVQFKYQN